MSGNRMVAVRREPQRGTLFACACGVRVWSAHGNAARHAARCALAATPPACGFCGGLLVRDLTVDAGLVCVRCRPR